MRKRKRKKKRNKGNQYYRKPSDRENYIADIVMRVVIAIIAFFIALVAQSFMIRGVIFIILSWHAFIVPTIVAIIVFFFPDALNWWFGEQNVSTLHDVKEAERKQRNNS